MKFFSGTTILLAETAAFGWFMLRDLSFITVIPLIPLGLLFYVLLRYEMAGIKWLNGVFAFASTAIVARTVSVGVFDGNGFFAVFFLVIAISLLAVGVAKGELRRISALWTILFLIVFIAMIIATVPGMRMRNTLPTMGNSLDILVFYLLAIIEPLSLGKKYRAAPLMLGVLLSLFGAIAYLALGNGAFQMAEYPYLSVWAGVAISAFQHTEGIILCLYCGNGALRLGHFFVEIGKKHCNEPKVIV